MTRLLSTALLLLTAPAAWASGIDRSGQGLGALFESGNYLEAAVGKAAPRVKGEDLGGGATGDVAGDFHQASLSLKMEATPQLSFALVLDQPYGAKILYGTGSTMLGGTLVDTSSDALMGLVRYRFNDVFSIHGGGRVQRSRATVHLKGIAYGAASGYELKLREDTAAAPVIGFALENPAIGLRLAATYHDAIRHQFKTREYAPLAPLNGNSTTQVTTPRAINVDFQTGVTASTLLFARLRWVKWSEFRVDPQQFKAITGEGLVDQRNSRSWTLGLAHRISSQWAAALALDYEGRSKPLSSPLAPVNGHRGVTLSAIYTRDNYRISTGLSYIKLGDAKLETGTPDTQRATMSGNSTLGIGTSVGWSF